MNKFLNERYALKEYVYGTEPNRLFEAQIHKLSPGENFFPAEGQGRNAGYAAKKGWHVYAFDRSSEARKKAQNLATPSGVSIHYRNET